MNPLSLPYTKGPAASSRFSCWFTHSWRSAKCHRPPRLDSIWPQLRCQGWEEEIFLTRNGFWSICLHMLTRSPQELDEFAEMFKALSNPNRLAIFLRLISRCPPGTSCAFDEEIRECVGDVGQDLGIARTTVSHHVKELRRAGLLRVERRGRNIECWVDGETVLILANLLKGRFPAAEKCEKMPCEPGIPKCPPGDKGLADTESSVSMESP